MRTTLTIDDDVVAMLQQLRKKREASFKDLVNDALRRGLEDMDAAARPTPANPFRTRSVDLGRVRIATIDNTAEMLATTEGEGFD
jgi:Ribbon-helix-helix protein, copG family